MKDNKTKIITSIIVFTLTFLFVISPLSDNLFSGTQSQPQTPRTQMRVAPQSSTQQQGPAVGPSARGNNQQTTTQRQSKPWSSTTWAAFILSIVFIIAVIACIILYRKEKKKSPNSFKTSLYKYLSVFLLPFGYLVVLIVVLSSRVYTHSIDAIMVDFKLFGIQIRIAYYGIIYAFGFIITYIWMKFEIKAKRLDFSPEQLDSFFIYGAIGVVLGARLFEAIFYVEPWYNFFWWKQGFASWSKGWKFIKVWEGGLSAHGGMTGAIVATILFCRKKGKSFYNIMDTVVLPVSLALALGRFANYINGELYGVITNGDWGVIFAQAAQPGQTNLPRIPTQLFESLKNLLIFAILFFLRDKEKFKKPGMIAWSWGLLYGLFRFIIELWKDYAILWKMGNVNFTMGNVLSLAMIGASGFVLYMMYKGKSFFSGMPKDKAKVKITKSGGKKKKLVKKKK